MRKLREYTNAYERHCYRVTLYDPATGVETHMDVTAKWIRENVSDPSVFLGDDWEKKR